MGRRRHMGVKDRGKGGGWDRGKSWDERKRGKDEGEWGEKIGGEER